MNVCLVDMLTFLRGINQEMLRCYFISLENPEKRDAVLGLENKQLGVRSGEIPYPVGLKSSTTEFL